MRFLAILSTFIALTLAVKHECDEFDKYSECLVECDEHLENKYSSDYPCLTEYYDEGDWQECYCALKDKHFKQLSECYNKCDETKLYPKDTPAGLRKLYCSDEMVPLGEESSVSSFSATATEKGEYLLSGTYADGYPWYTCVSIDESFLRTRVNVTTTESSKESNLCDDEKSKSNSSETETAAKTTSNGAQFLGISLISLIAIAFL